MYNYIFFLFLNQEPWEGRRWTLDMTVFFLALFLTCLLNVFSLNKGVRVAMHASIGAWHVDVVSFCPGDRVNESRVPLLGPRANYNYYNINTKSHAIAAVECTLGE